jgi:hypothetical protein
MTPIDWPAGLPCFRFEPYQVAPRPGAIEFDMGMLTHRARIYTQNNEVVSVEMVLTAAEEQALRTFYKTTLSMGTQWFNVDIWRESETQSVEALFFGAPPVFVPIAHNVVRASFTLLTRGEALPEPELDYDAIVLARDPIGYWRLDESSPATSFNDLSGNSSDVTYTGVGLTYSNPSLNLDGGTSLFRNSSGTNWYFGFDATSIFDADPLTPVTVGGWVKFANNDLSAPKTLFHIGGPGGGAQFTKVWAYREPTNGYATFFFHHLGGGTFANTISFTSIVLPIDTIFWFECGIDYGGSRFFFKKNDGAYEYIAFTANTPNGIDPGRGTCNFSIGRRTTANDGDAINGYFSHFELYNEAIVALGMWDDWHF